MKAISKPVMQYTRLPAIHRHYPTFNAVQCRSMPFNDILLHVCYSMRLDGRFAADSYLVVIFVKVHVRLCFYKFAYIDRFEIRRLEFLGLVLSVQLLADADSHCRTVADLA